MARLEEREIAIGGITLKGLGVTGDVTEGIETPAAVRGGTGRDPLEEALGRVEGVETVAAVTVDVQTAERGVSRSGGPAVAFDEVPSIEFVGPPTSTSQPGQIVVVEEAGRYRFVVPERRGGNEFSIPVEPARPGTDRGFTGALGRLAIRVIGVAARKVATTAAELAVRRLEESLRPHRIRPFGPSNHAGPTHDDVDLERLAGGPSLLLIHGTNSQTHLGFRFEQSYVRQLNRRYEDRVFAFDHPTFSFSPRENVDELVAMLGDVRLRDVDIVAHSRGGLIARTLVEQVKPTSLSARSVVLVATPNGGTPLAAGAHFADLVGHSVNVLTALPDNPVTDAIAIGLEALKDYVLQPAIEIMTGIEIMNPGSPNLRALNELDRPEGVVYRAVAANFEPRSTDSALTRARDLATDLIFRGVDNDLVVPTRSVYRSAQKFSIGLDARLVLDSSVGVDHSGFWSEDKVLRAFDSWLDPAVAVDETEPIPVDSSDPLAEIDDSLRAGDADALNAAIDRLTVGQRAAAEAVVGGALATGVTRGTASDRPKPNVIILPGIMGSRLSVDGIEIWANPWHLFRGRFRWLELGGADARIAEPSGLMRQYAPLVSHLARRWNVIPFAYDWRKDLAEAGRQLGELVEQRKLSDRPLQIVAHSMGGLVARSFIAQRGELWGAESRLIQLGTPNWGSFAIPGALRGDEFLVRALAFADAFNSKDELLDVVASFKGMYQLLPARDRALDDGEAEHQRLYERAAWHEERIRQDLLDASTTFQHSIADHTVDAGRTAYIAGDGHATPYRLRFEADGQMSVGVIRQGDGRVAHEFGHEPFGVPTYFSDATHGGLIADGDVLAALDQILETGETDRLATEPFTDRDGAKQAIEWMPAARLEDALGNSVPQRRDGATRTEHDARMAVDTALTAYIGGGHTGAVGVRPLEVKVVHASLEQAKYPVAAGWYEGLPIDGALRFLDRRLCGWLEEEREHGHYPTTAGTAIYVESPPGIWPLGAIVLGLGDFGALTPTRLSDAMAEGTMRYALDLARRQPAERPRTGVAAVLAGAPGTYGLGVAASLTAIVGGVARAAERLAEIVDITCLEIIEYYEGTAEQAASVLSQLADSVEAERFAVPLLADSNLESRPGGRRGVAQLGESGAPWPRIDLSFRASPSRRTGTTKHDAGDLDDGQQPDDDEKQETTTQKGPVSATSTLVYTALSRRARAQSLEVEVNRAGLRRLVQSAVAERSTDPQTNNTLYELLFPNQVKLELDELDNLHFLVDTSTAWIPWEVLANRDRDGDLRPLALRTGMLRQLKPDAKKVEVIMPGPQGLRALVIGDPPAGSGFPRLAGAHDEALRVAELLEGPGGHDVTRRIYDRSTEQDRSQDVRNAFFGGSYRIIHIAAHGVFEDDADDGTGGVVIGETERLTALDFTQRSVVPDLVFLNCCHVGRIEEYDPDVRRGHGHFADFASALALALIGSGVKAVIAAGWAVDDRAAQAFASTFYGEMIDGHTFGEAVRTARSAAHRADGGGSNTWGAYQCYGDPGFHFRGTDTATAGSLPFVSTNQVIQHLETVKISAGLLLDAESARREGARLDELWKREAARFGDARVLENAGAAYAELGLFDRAVAAYRLAIEDHTAQVSIKTIEQLANVEARLAAIRYRGEDEAHQRATEGGAAELFERAEEHLDLVFSHGTTAERLAIRGSLLKKKATTATNRRSRNSLIRRALKAYDAAIEEAVDQDVLSVYHASLAIQMASLLEADTEPATSQPRHAEMLERLESQLPNIDPTYGTSYDRAQRIDIVATGFIFRLQLGDEEVQQKIITGFTEVIDVRAPFRHRMSVIDHYKDLSELLLKHPTRAAEAEGAANIAKALEDHLPPGARGGRAPQVSAVRGAS